MELSCEFILYLTLKKQGNFMNNHFRWVHTVMQIKDSSEESQVPVIICTNQILRLVRGQTYS